jgi:FMN phosphatase YigB (HAD superfamily)
MAIYYRIVLTCIMLLTPAVHSMDNQGPLEVISFDLDGVFNQNIHLPKEFQLSPWIACLSNHSPLVQAAHKDNADLINKLTVEFETEQKPFAVYPVMPIVQLIKNLRSKGYLVVAATNQTVIMHKSCRRNLRDQHDLNLDDFFDVTLVTLEKNGNQPPPDESVLDNAPSLYHHVEGTLHAVSYQDLGKPHKHYYLALQSLVKSKHPKITKIIHIDDLKINILGAQQVTDMHGIHFDVDVRTADIATITAAVVKIKDGLKAHGIECD